jgi:hypothetical protein
MDINISRRQGRNRVGPSEGSRSVKIGAYEARWKRDYLCEPPRADPHAGWRGGWERKITPWRDYPILSRLSGFTKDFEHIDNLRFFYPL